MHRIWGAMHPFVIPRCASLPPLQSSHRSLEWGTSAIKWVLADRGTRSITTRPPNPFLWLPQGCTYAVRRRRGAASVKAGPYCVALVIREGRLTRERWICTVGVRLLRGTAWPGLRRTTRGGHRRCLRPLAMQTRGDVLENTMMRPRLRIHRGHHNADVETVEA